jgi:uncharacterized protein
LRGGRISSVSAAKQEGETAVTISLYDASVATYAQMLTGLANVFERGRAHFAETGVDPDGVLDASLAPDMLTLRMQAMVLEHHSLGALRSLNTGLMLSPSNTPPADYAAMQKLIADTRTALGGFGRAEIDALADRDVSFQAGEYKWLFTAEDFILSFSLPNFYFHVATAYGILRSKGVPVGKFDYMGAMRTKG